MASSFSKLNEKLVFTSLKKKLPLIGSFELTARCNLRCKMCFVCADTRETRDKELTATEWIETARQAQKSGTLYLMLTGGEALIREDFWEIYDAVYSMGFLITLNTNGTTITPEVMEKLSKKPPNRISVSIYGSSAEAYENVTGNADAFHKMKSGVELLLKGSSDVKLRTIFTKQTVDDIPEIAQMMLKWGKKIGLTNYVAPCRDITGINPLESRLTAAETFEAQDLLDKAVIEYYKQEAQKQTNENIQDAEDKNPQESINETAGKEDTNDEEWNNIDPSEIEEKDNPFKCGAGRYSYWVTWQGMMTPCALMAEPGVFVPAVGLGDAWKKIVDMSLKLPVCSECLDCVYKENCLTCPARLRIETGVFEKKAEYLCERAKLLTEIKNEKRN